jgi:LacI family transcriptional regulator
VINHSPNVNEATRQRVLQVIREQHYTPNFAARSLVTQRMHMLGLYVPYFISDLFNDPYFPTLLQAITTRANECDYDVMLWLRGADDTLGRLHDRVQNHRMTDGLILASTPRDDTLLDELVARGRTFVLNGRPWRHAETISYVDAENVQGAQQAVEHLARLGRRRIATITGRLDICSGHDRLQGYRAALEHVGLPIDPALIAEGDFSEDSGYRAMQRLLGARPDAVFAASDRMALGALNALREAGRRVPDDVALVGFDDLPITALEAPQLTTVHQPVTRLGHLAAEGLIGLLEGTITPPYQVVLPTELVIRQSCGFGP